LTTLFETCSTLLFTCCYVIRMHRSTPRSSQQYIRSICAHYAPNSSVFFFSSSSSSTTIATPVRLAVVRCAERRHITYTTSCSFYNNIDSDVKNETLERDRVSMTRISREVKINSTFSSRKWFHRIKKFRFIDTRLYTVPTHDFRQLVGRGRPGERYDYNECYRRI